MAIRKEEEQIQVAVPPFMAFGHMLPFFNLSVALARFGSVCVSYLSTPRNLQRLPCPPSDLPTLALEMVPLEFPEKPRDGEGKFFEGESTIDVLFNRLPYLKATYDLLLKPFVEFLDRSSIDFLIVDFSRHCACKAARERSIPVALFSTFNASIFAFFGSPEDLTRKSKRRLRSSPEGLTLSPPRIGFSSLATLRRHKAPWVLIGFYGGNAWGISDSQKLSDTLSGCDLVAIQSCYEFEGP